ncbi:hypothetical protein BHM03_00023906 [Ensete ventricosum]|nr:hypothetical protein BHM03_00023906 [Ensete ventricosum]
MSNFEVTLPELLNMLREAESIIKKEKPVFYVLAKPRSLARGEMDLKMGNGTRVTAVVVGEGTAEASATESLHQCRGSSDGEGAQ